MYSNARRKEFGYKTNDKAPPNTEQTLCARLASVSAAVKAKRVLLREQPKEPSLKPSAKSRLHTPQEGNYPSHALVG